MVGMTRLSVGGKILMLSCLPLASLGARLMFVLEGILCVHVHDTFCDELGLVFSKDLSKLRRHFPFC